MADEYRDLDKQVEEVWVHPLGGRITVFKDGSFKAVNKEGKRKTTTATPDKLAAGYGLWKREEEQ
jgi:hypothetical protein